MEGYASEGEPGEEEVGKRMVWDMASWEEDTKSIRKVAS